MGSVPVCFVLCSYSSLALTWIEQQLSVPIHRRWAHQAVCLTLEKLRVPESCSILRLLATMYPATLVSKLVSLRILLKPLSFPAMGAASLSVVGFCFPFHQPASKKRLMFFPRAPAWEWAVVCCWPGTIALEISLDTRHLLSLTPVLLLADPQAGHLRSSFSLGGVTVWRLHWRELWGCLLSLWTGTTHCLLNCSVS